MRRALPVLFVGLLAGCRPDPHAARKALESPDPQKRLEGATALQKIYRKDPSALGDHGEKYWVDRLVGLKGASSAKADEILAGCQPMGAEGGGGAGTYHYRLDDFWTTDVHRSDRKFEIFGYTPPRRNVVSVYVARPPKLTGTWTTYFVSGAVYDTFELAAGVPLRNREYHDNGQLRREDLYVDGEREGTVITHFPNGKTEWEETRAKGKLVGVQKLFGLDGKLLQEDHWRDDQRDGRTTYYGAEGTPTLCIDYRAGVEVGRGCHEPEPK